MNLKMLTVTEAAFRLGVGEVVLRHLIRAGHVRTFRFVPEGARKAGVRMDIPLADVTRLLPAVQWARAHGTGRTDRVYATTILKGIEKVTLTPFVPVLEKLRPASPPAPAPSLLPAWTTEGGPHVANPAPPAPALDANRHRMDLRDMFADTALAVLMRYKIGGDPLEPAAVARGAYEYADAMLHARKGVSDV
jgi:hypothetical protein